MSSMAKQTQQMASMVRQRAGEESVCALGGDSGFTFRAVLLASDQRVRRLDCFRVELT